MNRRTQTNPLIVISIYSGESAVLKDHAMHAMKKQTVTCHGIPFDRDVVEKFCLKNGIRKLSLFGSVLRDDFGHDSDIDVLVEFMPDARVGFFELFDMEEELSHILGGRKVGELTTRARSGKPRAHP